ncbi:MAG: T9SS type A sorting domain-containing protein [Ignavibacteriales bacterium]|nr:T9SS type A sorting domain-containing protein [Ignavibacteriales bacterium]
MGFREGKGSTSEPQEYSYSDILSEITPSKLYYRLKQIDFNGDFEYSNIIEIEIAPSAFSLAQNYPNPFNPSTNISYQLPAYGFVSLKVYDVLGNEVATLVNEEQKAGVYSINFNAQLLSSGVYYYQLKSGNNIQTKKMILTK